MRIDKYLSSHTSFSRKEIHGLIKKGFIRIDDQIVDTPRQPIDIQSQKVYLDGDLIGECHYYILNKPKGFVSSHKAESHHPSLFDLLPQIKKEKFSISGRLDQDSTGLVLISDDGLVVHRIMSPKYHLPKTYQVCVHNKLTPSQMEEFQRGFELGKDFTTLPAKLEYKGDSSQGYHYQVILSEGKFHQIKRMFAHFDSKVLSLHRTSIGPIQLPSDLSSGNWRNLSSEEVCFLKLSLNIKEEK